MTSENQCSWATKSIKDLVTGLQMNMAEIIIHGKNVHSF